MKALFMHILFFLQETCMYVCSPSLMLRDQTHLWPFFYNEQITCTDMIILRQNGFLHNYLKFKQRNLFFKEGK